MNRRKFLLVSVGSAAVVAAGGKAAIELPVANTSQDKAKQTGRLAMLIDLQKCAETGNGCDKCIKACHHVHNVPHFGNEKDEIKWIWKEPFQRAFIEQENELLPQSIHNRQVILMCNHCDNPPCTNVCPTQATWKRDDGIVMIDWHRCVGCRYCIAACPYGSRSFNWREPKEFIADINEEFPARTRGVVEKCTFCTERLSQGLRPACVESCPSGAILFGDLYDKTSEIRKALGSRFTIKRKAELGTKPEIYYSV